MDYYDPALSLNNNSTLVEPVAPAHSTGDPEFPDCLSDLYPAFVNNPTSEIINAIEGRGITRNASVLNQLLQAINSVIPNYIVLEDQKTPGTDGGAFASGSFLTRDLNTEVIDQGGNVSLAGNAFTLDAGTYAIRASAPAIDVNEHQARLQNITDVATTLMGTSEFTEKDPAGPHKSTSRSIIDGVFTIAASKVFEIQHRCTTTGPTDGFGNANGFAGSLHEKYTIVVLQKLP